MGPQLFLYQNRCRLETRCAFNFLNMKYILFYLFSLPPLSAQEITKDTSWLTNTAGIFYNVARVEYDNGAYSESSTVIGDTLAVVCSVRQSNQQFRAAVCECGRNRHASAG